MSAQIDDAIKNPKTLEDSPNPIIYHELLKPRKDGKPIPSPVSLFEEAQNLTFAGIDTNANVLMIGTFHILEDHLWFSDWKMSFIAHGQISRIPRG